MLQPKREQHAVSLNTTSRFGSLGRLHQLCQLDGLGYPNPAFSTLNLGYDEPKRRKFAVFSECLRLIAGSIARVLWIPKDARAKKIIERLRSGGTQVLLAGPAWRAITTIHERSRLCY